MECGEKVSSEEGLWTKHQEHCDKERSVEQVGTVYAREGKRHL